MATCSISITTQIRYTWLGISWPSFSELNSISLDHRILIRVWPIFAIFGLAYVHREIKPPRSADGNVSLNKLSQVTSAHVVVGWLVT